MTTIKLWIYTAQMLRIAKKLYSDMKQVSDEVYEIQDTPEGFGLSQDYVSDMTGNTLTVIK